MNRLRSLVFLAVIGAAQCFFDNSFIYPRPQRSWLDPFNSYREISYDNGYDDKPQDYWSESRDVLAPSGAGKPLVYTEDNFPVPGDGSAESEPSSWFIPRTTAKPIPDVLLDTLHYISSKMDIQNAGRFIDFSKGFYRTNCDTYDWRPRQFFKQLLTRSGFHFHIPYLSMYLSDVLTYHNTLLAGLNQKIDEVEASNNRKLKNLENDFQVRLNENSKKFNRVIKKVHKAIVRHTKHKSSFDSFLETMLKLKKSFKATNKPRNVVIAPNFVDFHNSMNHYEINKNIRIVENGCGGCAHKPPTIETTTKTSSSPDLNENKVAQEEDEFKRTKKPENIEDSTKGPESHRTASPLNPDAEKNDVAPDEGEYNKPKEPQTIESSTESPKTSKPDTSLNPDIVKDEEAPDEDEYNKTKKPPTTELTTLAPPSVSGEDTTTVVPSSPKKPNTEKDEEAPEDDALDETKKPRITSTESPKVTLPYGKQEAEENNEEEDNERTKNPTTLQEADVTTKVPETKTDASKTPEKDKYEENAGKNGQDVTISPNRSDFSTTSKKDTEKNEEAPDDEGYDGAKKPGSGDLTTATTTSEHLQSRSTPKPGSSEAIENPTKPETERIEDAPDEKQIETHKDPTKVSEGTEAPNRDNFEVTTEGAKEPEPDKNEDASDEDESNGTKVTKVTEQPTSKVYTEATHRPDIDENEEAPDEGEYSQTKKPSTTPESSSEESTENPEVSSMKPASSEAAKATEATVEPQVTEDITISRTMATNDFQVVTASVPSVSFLPEIVDEVTILPKPITITSSETTEATVKPQTIEDITISRTMATNDFQVVTASVPSVSLLPEIVEEVTILPKPITPMPPIEVDDQISNTIENYSETVTIKPPEKKIDEITPAPIPVSHLTPAIAQTTTKMPTYNDEGVNPDEDETKSEAHLSKDTEKPSAPKPQTPKLSTSTARPTTPSNSQYKTISPVIPNESGSGYYPGGGVRWTTRPPNTGDMWKLPGGHKPSDELYENPYSDNSWQSWDNGQPGQGKPSSRWTTKRPSGGDLWNFSQLPHKPSNSEGTWNNWQNGQGWSISSRTTRRPGQEFTTRPSGGDLWNFSQLPHRPSNSEGTWNNWQNGQGWSISSRTTRRPGQGSYWNLPESHDSNEWSHNWQNMASGNFGGGMHKLGPVVVNGKMYYELTCFKNGEKQKFWIKQNQQHEITEKACTDVISYPRVSDEDSITKLEKFKLDSSVSQSLGGSMKASQIVVDGHSYYLITCSSGLKKTNFWIKYDSKEKLKYEVCTDNISYPHISDQYLIGRLEKMRVEVYGPGIQGSGISMNGHTYYQVSCNINHKEQTFWIKLDSQGDLPEDVCSNLGEYSRITDKAVIDQLSHSTSEGTAGSMKFSGIAMDGHSYYLVSCKGHGKIHEDTFWIQYDAQEKLTYDVCFDTAKFPRITDERVIGKLTLLTTGGSRASMKASQIVVDGHSYYLITCSSGLKKTNFWIKYDSKEKLKYEVCTDNMRYPHISDQYLIGRLEKMRVEVYGPGIQGSGISMNGHTYYQVSCNINHKEQTFWIKLDSQGDLPEDVCSNLGEYSRITDKAVIEQLSHLESKDTAGSMKFSRIAMDGHSYYLVSCEGHGKIHEDTFWIQYDAQEKLTYDVCFDTAKFPRITDESVIGKLTLLTTGGSRASMKASQIVVDGHSYYLITCSSGLKKTNFWIKYDSKEKLKYEVCTDNMRYPHISDQYLIGRLEKMRVEVYGPGIQGSGISMNGHTYYQVSCNINHKEQTFWIKLDSQGDLPEDICSNLGEYSRITDMAVIDQLSHFKSEGTTGSIQASGIGMDGHAYYYVNCTQSGKYDSFWIQHDSKEKLSYAVCTDREKFPRITDEATIRKLTNLIRPGSGGGMEASGMSFDGHLYYFVKCTTHGDTKTFWIQHDSKEKLPFNVCEDEVQYPRIADEKLLQQLEQQRAKMLALESQAHRMAMDGHTYFEVTCGSGSGKKKVWINYDLPGDLPSDLCINSATHTIVMDPITIDNLNKLRIRFSRVGMKARVIRKGGHAYYQVSCGTDEPFWIEYDRKEELPFDVCTDSKTYPRITDKVLIEGFSDGGNNGQKVSSVCLAFKTGSEEKIYCNVTCPRGTYSEVFFITVADAADTENFCDRRKYPAIEESRLLAKLTLAFSRTSTKGQSAYDQSCVELGPDIYCKVTCSKTDAPLYTKPETKDVTAEDVCTHSKKFNQVAFGNLPKALQKYWSS